MARGKLILFWGLFSLVHAWAGPRFLPGPLTDSYFQALQLQLEDGKVLTVPASFHAHEDGSMEIWEDGKAGILASQGIRKITLPVEQGADHLANLFEKSAPDRNPNPATGLWVWMFSAKSDPVQPEDFIPTVWTGIRIKVGPLVEGAATSRQIFAEVARLGITPAAEIGIQEGRKHVNLATLPSTKSSSTSFALADHEIEVRESLIAKLPDEQRTAVQTFIAREHRTHQLQILKARALRFFRWAAISAVAVSPAFGAHYWAHHPENPEAWGAPAIRHFEETLAEKFRDCLGTFQNLR